MDAQQCVLPHPTGVKEKETAGFRELGVTDSGRTEQFDQRTKERHGLALNERVGKKSKGSQRIFGARDGRHSQQLICSLCSGSDCVPLAAKANETEGARGAWSLDQASQAEDSST